MYKKFYEYLETIKEKGRNVKRDYLEQVLGKEKIGAYHLVEQIVRLKRVLDKIPKYLWYSLLEFFLFFLIWRIIFDQDTN